MFFVKKKTFFIIGDWLFEPTRAHSAQPAFLSPPCLVFRKKSQVECG